MTAFSWHSDAVAGAFRRSASRVDEIRRGRWHLELRNGKAVSAVAVLHDSCLRLSAPATVPRHETPAWRLMTIHSRLPGDARFTLDRATGALSLLVEVFIDFRSMDARVLDHACDALLRAVNVAHAGKDDTNVEPVELPAINPAPGTGVPSWTEEWNDPELPLTPVGDGRWTVDVEVRNGNAHIVIEHAAEGIVCHATVADAPRSDTSREAMARFLLGASYDARFVRATTRRDGENHVASVRFEATLPAAPRPVDVERGIMAVASACDRFGAETRALADEWLAARYCSVRHAVDGAAEPARPCRALVAWKRFLPGGSHAVG